MSGYRCRYMRLINIRREWADFIITGYMTILFVFGSAIVLVLKLRVDFVLIL